MLRKFLVLLSAIPLALSGIAPAVAANPLQITFESDDTSGYMHEDFDDDGPSRHTSSVTSGIEGNAGTVLKVVRGVASWAGTTIIKDQSKALIATGTLYVTANINAPVAGKKLMMKLEKMTDVTQSVEAYATQDTVVGWHEYTFDFSIQRPGTEAFSANKTYNMASVFFDYTTSPNPSTAGLTYYLDDVTFASATAGSGGTGGGDNGGGGNGGGGVVNNATATPIVLTYEADDTLGALGAATASPAHPVGIFGGGTAAMVTDYVGLGSSSNKVLAVTKTGEAWTTTPSSTPMARFESQTLRTRVFRSTTSHQRQIARLLCSCLSAKQWTLRCRKPLLWVQTASASTSPPPALGRDRRSTQSWLSSLISSFQPQFQLLFITSTKSQSTAAQRRRFQVFALLTPLPQPLPTRPSK